MRDYSCQDQKTITRWFLGAVALYSFIALVLIAIVVVRTNVIEPKLQAMHRGNATSAMLSWGTP
jgi:Na+/H+-dicarboxylate symporter